MIVSVVVILQLIVVLLCYSRLQEDATGLSNTRFSPLVTDESKEAASRRHVPTSPRGKAAHASSHRPRDLDPDYARTRRVCRSVWQGSSVLQRELLREEQEMRAERQDVLPPSRAHDPARGRQLSGHSQAVQRLQRLFCDVRRVCKMDRPDRTYCKGDSM